MKELFNKFDALRNEKKAEKNARAKCIKFQRILRRKINRKGPTMDIRNKLMIKRALSFVSNTGHVLIE